MDDQDFRPSASVNGLLNCIRALHEEAATLRLQRTLEALEEAFETAAAEGGLNTHEDFTRVSTVRVRLH